jgi:hypothetical protein
MRDMKTPRRVGVHRLLARRWWILCALLLGLACIAYCSGDVTRPSSRPAVTTTTLSAGGVGVVYSATLAARGGNGKYVWTLASGSLPVGLHLGRTGTIAGTPTAAGNYAFTVEVTSARARATRAFTLDVAAALHITSTASLPGGFVGQPYHSALTVTGGDASNQWSLASGALPAGLTLSAAGVIAGTPTAVDTADFQLRVANALGQSTTSAALLSTLAAPVVLTSSLAAGAVGVAYQTDLAASGGDGTYAWTLAEGGLPAGLALGTTGAIAGMPLADGNFGITVQVTSAGASTTRAFTLVVAPALHITSTTSLPRGIVGRPYEATLTATGGDVSNEWSLATGALPVGLTLSV